MAGVHVRWIAAVGMVLVGCAGTYEASVHRDMDEQSSRSLAGRTSRAGRRSSAAVEDSSRIDGGLAGYVALAVENNPDAETAFERWRASIHRISRARRLPEPTLGFGYFVRSVETRVGPQQARISLQQTFPWPTRLTAGADAASAQARAAQRRFEAQALAVVQRVAEAYWNLWQIRHTRAIHQEHLEVIRGLSATVLARMATGAASLADQQQVDLAAARLEDSIFGMDEAEIAAVAQLGAAIGQDLGPEPATTEAPEEPLPPADSPEVLAGFARVHPMIASFGLMAEAQESAARAEAAERFPSFTVGADWIITGEAMMAGVQDSGKDAVIIGAGIRIPLWQGSYGDAIEAARAEAQAHRAEQRSAIDRTLAELQLVLSLVRDAIRRVHLYGETLLPQAESAYASVLGAYVAGRSTVAQTLLAQRDLLELRVDRERARADYGRAWARLDQVVGRETPRATSVAGPRVEIGRPHD